MPRFPSLAALGVVVAAACPIPSMARPQGEAQFKVQSDLVVLHVTVKDRNGGFVTDLGADAFLVLEERRPQTIRFFGTEDAPVTIGLVIDSSGSMWAVRDRVIAASAAFVTSSNPQDEIFALVFNDNVRPVLTPSAPFTKDAGMLQEALTNVFAPTGRTALYDAIADGLGYVAKGTLDRRVLVVMSDGGDNASRATFRDALTLAQASNTVIYTVALVDASDTDANPKRLKQLAETTGGVAFAPTDVAGVGRAFQQIAREIRHGYTIGYEPADMSSREGFHRIRVDVQSADGHHLVTRTRTGYLGLADRSHHAP